MVSRQLLIFWQLRINAFSNFYDWDDFLPTCLVNFGKLRCKLYPDGLHWTNYFLFPQESDIHFLSQARGEVEFQYRPKSER